MKVGVGLERKERKKKMREEEEDGHDGTPALRTGIFSLRPPFSMSSDFISCQLPSGFQWEKARASRHN